MSPARSAPGPVRPASDLTVRPRRKKWRRLDRLSSGSALCEATLDAGRPHVHASGPLFRTRFRGHSVAMPDAAPNEVDQEGRECRPEA